MQISALFCSKKLNLPLLYGFYCRYICAFPGRLKQASAGVYLLLYMEKAGCCPGFAHGMRIIRRWRICCRSRAVLRVTAVGVVVSDIGHARLSVGAKPGRLQGVKPPAGIFGRRGGGMFLLCILLFAQ